MFPFDICQTDERLYLRAHRNCSTHLPSVDARDMIGKSTTTHMTICPPVIRTLAHEPLSLIQAVTRKKKIMIQFNIKATVIVFVRQYETGRKMIICSAGYGCSLPISRGGQITIGPVISKRFSNNHQKRKKQTKLNRKNKTCDERRIIENRKKKITGH